MKKRRCVSLDDLTINKIKEISLAYNGMENISDGIRIIVKEFYNQYLTTGVKITVKKENENECKGA